MHFEAFAVGLGADEDDISVFEPELFIFGVRGETSTFSRRLCHDGRKEKGRGRESRHGLPAATFIPSQPLSSNLALERMGRNMAQG